MQEKCLEVFQDSEMLNVLHEILLNIHTNTHTHLKADLKMTLFVFSILISDL